MSIIKNNPEAFLKQNDQYDTLIVGDYCKKRDPNLAFIAYSKGHNDLELISITNDNSMFKPQARYILERGDEELWAFVLSANNMHRRSVVDQVISTAVVSFLSYLNAEIGECLHSLHHSLQSVENGCPNSVLYIKLRRIQQTDLVISPNPRNPRWFL